MKGRKCTTLLLRNDRQAECGRRATFTAIHPFSDEPQYVCGMHANMANRMGWKLIEGVWVREG